MGGSLLPTNPVNQNWNALKESRKGIMLHYDDSGSDTGALDWLTKDPTCKVSYNVLVLDNGVAYIIAPLDKRAYHAGVCKPSNDKLGYKDANSAFYGVAIAAKDGEQVTPKQFEAVVQVCRQLARMNNWDLSKDGWRITGHSSEAWLRGRKIDPEGKFPDSPVLSVSAVRRALQVPFA